MSWHHHFWSRKQCQLLPKQKNGVHRCDQLYSHPRNIDLSFLCTLRKKYGRVSRRKCWQQSPGDGFMGVYLKSSQILCIFKIFSEKHWKKLKKNPIPPRHWANTDLFSLNFISSSFLFFPILSFFFLLFCFILCLIVVRRTNLKRSIYLNYASYIWGSSYIRKRKRGKISNSCNNSALVLGLQMIAQCFMQAIYQNDSKLNGDFFLSILMGLMKDPTQQAVWNRVNWHSRCWSWKQRQMLPKQ